MELENELEPGVATKTKDGRYVVRIDNDQDAESPRNYDNLGTMVCVHRRRDLGDISLHSADELKSWYETQYPESHDPEAVFKANNLVLPLSLLDHSGLTMWVGYPPHPCDPGGWDSGRIGFIYVSHEGLRREYGRKRLHKSVLADAEKVLRAEVETYNSWFRGDYWCYTISKCGNDDDVVDSCCGLEGWDYAVAEVKAVLDSLETKTQEGQKDEVN